MRSRESTTTPTALNLTRPGRSTYRWQSRSRISSMRSRVSAICCGKPRAYECCDPADMARREAAAAMTRRHRKGARGREHPRKRLLRHGGRRCPTPSWWRSSCATAVRARPPRSWSCSCSRTTAASSVSRTSTRPSSSVAGSVKRRRRPSSRGSVAERRGLVVHPADGGDRGAAGHQDARPHHLGQRRAVGVAGAASSVVIGGLRDRCRRLAGRDSRSSRNR